MPDANDELKLHEAILKLIELITAQKERGAKAVADEFYHTKGLYEKLKEQIKLKKSLDFFDKDSLKNFTELGKRLKENNDRIKLYKDKVQEIVDLGDKANKEEKELLGILNKKIKSYQDANDEIKKSITATTKWGASLKLASEAVVGIGAGIRAGYGMIKNSGLFEMDKAIKNSALSMGILSKQSDDFATQLTEAAKDTIQFGIGIEDLAKMQASYSESMGRTVIFGKQAAEQLAKVAASSGLGAEGAGELAGSLDTVGFSAGETSKYIQQAMDDAHAMGLNASKVVKTIAANIKLLNRFNFKNGAEGLAKMVQETQRLGVELQIAAPFAEKIFDVEGAVEMSAQLQVLGGEWAKLADPFKLMYMARNDMEGLTKAVIKATTATATFNKETGQFDISSLEMQRLRKVAEATGMDFEQLAQSAKKAAQFAAIKKQISYGFDPETEKFIESTAILDKNKRAKIEIDGSPKFLNELTAADKTLLTQRAREKEDMAERAKGNRTFDDTLNNTITLFKQLLLPIITTLNEKLMPKVDKFVESFKSSDWPDKILKFAKTIGEIASSIGGFIINNPKLTVGLLVGAKALGVVMDKVTWFTNGLALAEGFKTGSGMGGAVGGGGPLGFLAKNIGKLSIATGLLAGVTSFIANKEKGMGNGESFGRSALTAGATALGAFAGGALGSAVAPGIGTMAGGAAGAWGGGKIGDWLGNQIYGESTNATPVNDGVIQFNPKDKFTKVDDGTLVAGTNPNGNRDLANQLAARPATMNSVTQNQIPGNININFGQLTMGGSIELKLGMNYSRELGKELIQNPAFIRDITKLIHMETEKNLNSGKPKG